MNLKYRPEIDGLRTVAVLAVVFYHAGFGLFGGGYVGVDVFFVISGYLITFIILTQLKNKNFSFLKFYERRARRLLPALFTVILTSLPFAWLYMTPKAIKEYAGSVISALFFSSNFWFFSEDSYWAEKSELKPFLNLWSLSLEEQFYFLFPIALFLAWKVAPRYIGWIFILIGLGSLQFSNYYTPQIPKLTFFLLPARAWELLAGAILAKLEINYGRTNNPILEKIGPSVGIGLILFAIVFFTNQTKHPSFITILPVLGTMLLIRFTRKGELITSILSNKLMVGIGLISYSLYLWHGPIFAFDRIKKDVLSQSDKFEGILLAFLLAVLTYFFVERPTRKNTSIGTKKFLITIISSSAVIFAIQAYIYLSNGLPNRFKLASIYKSTIKGFNYKKHCSAPGGVDELFEKRWCRILKDKDIKDKSKKKFLVLGDSHARSLMTAFHEIAIQTKRQGLFTYYSSCPPFIGADITKSYGTESAKKCATINEEALTMVKNGEVSTVFLVAKWDHYLDHLGTKRWGQIHKTIESHFNRREAFYLLAKDTIAKYVNMSTRKNFKLIIVLQIPHQTQSIQKVISARASQNVISNEYLKKHSLSKEKHFLRHMGHKNIFEEITSSYKNVFIVDPTKALCDTKCLIGDDKSSFYINDHHLSSTGARKVIPILEKYLL